MSALDPVQIAALEFAEGKQGVGNDNENSVPVYTCGILWTNKWLSCWTWKLHRTADPKLGIP